jgi:hypothetical protein
MAITAKTYKVIIKGSQDDARVCLARFLNDGFYLHTRNHDEAGWVIGIVTTSDYVGLIRWFHMPATERGSLLWYREIED